MKFTEMNTDVTELNFFGSTCYSRMANHQGKQSFKWVKASLKSNGTAENMYTQNIMYLSSWSSINEKLIFTYCNILK